MKEERLWTRSENEQIRVIWINAFRNHPFYYCTEMHVHPPGGQPGCYE